MENKFKIEAAERKFADTGEATTGQSAAIEMVQTKSTGGIYTWLRKFLYPFYGFPEKNTVMAVADIKQIFPFAIRFCSQKRVIIIFGFLFLFFRKTFIKLVTEAIDCFTDMAWATFQRFPLPHIKHNRPVRELLRVIDILIEKEDSVRKRKKLETKKDVFCKILQYDNAYLLRAQDGMGEINLEALKKRPIREIWRVLNIVARREILSRPMRKKIKAIRNAVCLFLMVSKEYRNLVKAFAKEVNLEEIKLDEGDWYYCRRRKDYDFGDRKKNKIYPLNETKNMEINLERLEARKQAVQAQFDQFTKEKNELDNQRKQLGEQDRTILKRMGDVDMEIFRLQGRFAEIQEEEGHLKGVIENEEKQKEKEQKEEVKVENKLN